MHRNITFGQYLHRESFLHRLDPRLKLVYTTLLSIWIFMVDDFHKLVMFSAFVFLLAIFTRISVLDYIKNLRPFLPVFLLILVMYLVFSREQLPKGLIAIWRFILMIFMSMILCFTTTFSNLVEALQFLLKPLKIFGIKSRNVAIMVSISARFVPVMFLYFENLRQAMASRLANFKKANTLKLMMMNMFERLLKSASVLSYAMQSRPYNENAKSSKILKLNGIDYTSMAIMLVFIAVIY